MTDDQQALDAISQIYRTEPHFVTPLMALNVMFKRDRNPRTGEPLGPPYLNPIVRAGLERQGHDAEVFAAKMETRF